MKRNFEWPEDRLQLAELLDILMFRVEDSEDWDVDWMEHQPFKDPALEAWRQRILREVWPGQFPSEGPEADQSAKDHARKIIDGLRQGQNA